MARMRPCFRGAVKIATVVAARPRGGSDAGRLASTAAWAGLVGAPWLARVLQLRYPGERPAAVGGWAGDGVGRFAGVRGRSADPRWLSDRWPLLSQLAGSAVWAHALVRRRGTRAARAFGRAVAQQVGSFVGSCVMEVYSKKLDYQSGRPDLNQRPLDPQSRSVRRWVSPDVGLRWLLVWLFRAGRPAARRRDSKDSE